MVDLKYKVGDRVRIKSIDWYNENKASDDEIRCHPIWFGKEHSKYCGQIMTISDVRGGLYYMIEDDGDVTYAWTDEMIECKVEEECPQDFIDKYCISCGTQRCDRTKEYLDGCPYYNEYMSIKQNNTSEIVDYVKESNDRYRIVIDPRFDIEVDEGEYYAVRRKKEYPKTYEECCSILNLNTDCGVRGYKVGLLSALQMLLICRDAYWKIAGEEMGLDKPWENGRYEVVYAICRDEGNIVKRDDYWGDTHVFEFPIREMRDAFFNAFRDDIEKCKELI